MPRARSERILRQARHLAVMLLASLEKNDVREALACADQLHRTGLASLGNVAPRGSARFAASCRLRGEEDVIVELLVLLSEGEVPREAWPAVFDVLGVWAGEEAVAVIDELLRGSTGDDEETARLMQRGFDALRSIGGERAVRALEAFGRDRRPAVSDRASWYLGQLDAPAGDLTSWRDEPEPASADEVAVRDSLWDPFRWREAAEKFAEYLGWLYRSEAKRHARTLKDAGLDVWSFDRSMKDARHDLGEALEPAVLAGLVRLSDVRLLALAASAELFPSGDLAERRACEVPEGWVSICLTKSSPSARYLCRLELPVAPREDVWREAVGDAPSRDLFSLMRTWALRLPCLAEEYRTKDLLPVAAALAMLSAAVQQRLGGDGPQSHATLPAWLGLAVR